MRVVEKRSFLETHDQSDFARLYVWCRSPGLHQGSKLLHLAPVVFVLTDLRFMTFHYTLPKSRIESVFMLVCTSKCFFVGVLSTL